VNHGSLSDFRVAQQAALDELFTAAAAGSGKWFRRPARLREHLEAEWERVRQMGDPRQKAVSSGQAKGGELKAASEQIPAVSGSTSMKTTWHDALGFGPASGALARFLTTLYRFYPGGWKDRVLTPPKKRFLTPCSSRPPRSSSRQAARRGRRGND
jgi:hypothetical protein